MLTEPVTRSLPTPWQRDYTVDRARRWIAERDAEGATLLVVSKSSGQALGLMLLFEASPPDDLDGTEVRLGYLLAEAAWGQGLASELVAGFVAWCRTQPGVGSIAGGVEPGNVASQRVLEKNGFRPSDLADDRASDEDIMRLRLR